MAKSAIVLIAFAVIACGQLAYGDQNRKMLNHIIHGTPSVPVPTPVRAKLYSSFNSVADQAESGYASVVNKVQVSVVPKLTQPQADSLTAKNAQVQSSWTNFRSAVNSKLSVPAP